MTYDRDTANRDSDRALAGYRARKDITDHTTICVHGWPTRLCNQCSDDLADAVVENIEELLG
jgi:hypothetical protein